MDAGQSCGQEGLREEDVETGVRCGVIFRRDQRRERTGRTWIGLVKLELLRGYHSSSCGGVIYYMYNTSTPFYPFIPQEMRQTSVNVDRCRLLALR